MISSRRRDLASQTCTCAAARSQYCVTIHSSDVDVMSYARGHCIDLRFFINLGIDVSSMDIAITTRKNPFKRLC
jgi:hypothetical protein